MTHRKKILFVITKSNYGGAQRYVYELATGLPKDEYEVVVAFGGNGLLKKKLEEGGIRTRTIKSFERDISISKEFRALAELLEILKEERPDIIHLNSSKAGGTGALAARIRGVKNIIYTAHGWPFYEDRSIVWRVIIWLASYVTTLLSHHVIVVSKHDHEKAWMPLMSHKLHHIPTALPEIAFKTREEARTSLFSKESIETHKNDLWLVSTGEHTRNKNLSLILDAMEQLPQHIKGKLFLTLMSDGEDREKLEALVRTFRLENRVHFTGFVDNARSFLPAFDVFLLPSLKEGFPYGLLEAGATGLAVIASNVGGIPELIKNGETGTLIDPRDVHSLINALVGVIEQREEIMTQAEKLRSIIRAEYTIGRMMAETEAIYSRK